MILQALVNNRTAIIGSLKRVEKRLALYDVLQRSLLATNVAEYLPFQRSFNSYYVVRGRGKEWRRGYFSILEREKMNRSVGFAAVLEEIAERVSLVELSFTSKLVATINPHRPVFDSNVGKCLGLKGTSSWKSFNARFSQAIGTYERLEAQTAALVGEEGFGVLRDSFDEEFPQFCHFTDMKKLDLFLWRFGDLIR